MEADRSQSSPRWSSATNTHLCSESTENDSSDRVGYRECWWQCGNTTSVAVSIPASDAAPEV